MKQLKSFAGICVFALGAIGGTGYAIYSEAWVIAAGVVGLAVMAIPTLKQCLNTFKS